MLTFTKQGLWTSVVIFSIWTGWQIWDRNWIAAVLLFLLPVCVGLLWVVRHNSAKRDVAVEMKTLRGDVDNLAQRLTVLERTVASIRTSGTPTDSAGN